MSMEEKYEREDEEAEAMKAKGRGK